MPSPCWTPWKPTRRDGARRLHRFGLNGPWEKSKGPRTFLGYKAVMCPRPLFILPFLPRRVRVVAAEPLMRDAHVHRGGFLIPSGSYILTAWCRRGGCSPPEWLAKTCRPAESNRV